jgi:hypothetical protein
MHFGYQSKKLISLSELWFESSLRADTRRLSMSDFRHMTSACPRTAAKAAAATVLLTIETIEYVTAAAFHAACVFRRIKKKPASADSSLQVKVPLS